MRSLIARGKWYSYPGGLAQRTSGAVLAQHTRTDEDMRIAKAYTVIGAFGVAGRADDD